MAIRNIQGIGNPKPIPIYHVIPPAFQPLWRVEIVTDYETIDVTELFTGYYSDAVTSSIGDFEITIIDPIKQVSSRVNNYDEVVFYLDYAGKAEFTEDFFTDKKKADGTTAIWGNN